MRAAATEALQAAYDLDLQEGDERDQVAVAESLLELAQGELDETEARLLLASAYRRSGRMDDGERLARDVRELAARKLYPAVMVTAGHHLARALYSLGRLDEAEHAAADAEQLSARIGERADSCLRCAACGRPSRSAAATGERASTNCRQTSTGEPDPHYQSRDPPGDRHLAFTPGRATCRDRCASPPGRRGRLPTRCRLPALRSRSAALRSVEALARLGDVAEARAQMSSPAVARARRSYESRIHLARATGSPRLAGDPPERAALALARLSDRLTAAGFHREALLGRP